MTGGRPTDRPVKLRALVDAFGLAAPVAATSVTRDAPVKWAGQDRGMDEVKNHAKPERQPRNLTPEQEAEEESQYRRRPPQVQPPTPTPKRTESPFLLPLRIDTDAFVVTGTGIVLDAKKTLLPNMTRWLKLRRSWRRRTA